MIFISAIYFFFLVSYSILIYLMFGKKNDDFNMEEKDEFNKHLSSLDAFNMSDSRVNSSAFNTLVLGVQDQQQCWNTDPVCRRDTGKI